MNFENVSVLSVAHVDAPHRITSEEIEKQLAPTMERLGIRPDLLRDLSGIMERRVWDEGMQPSQAAAMAGEPPLLKSHQNITTFVSAPTTDESKTHVSDVSPSV